MSRAFERSALARNALVAGVAVLLGLAGGAAVAFAPPWIAFAALLALVPVYLVLRSTDVGLASSVLIATILPFGTLPFKAGVTPNFLELALLALLAIWLLRLLINPDQSLELTPLGLPLIGFLGVTLFSFILGSNASPDSLTLHNYFKFVLAVLFFVARRTPAQASWLTARAGWRALGADRPAAVRHARRAGRAHSGGAGADRLPHQRARAALRRRRPERR